MKLPDQGDCQRRLMTNQWNQYQYDKCKFIWCFTEPDAYVKFELPCSSWLEADALHRLFEHVAAREWNDGEVDAFIKEVNDIKHRRRETDDKIQRNRRMYRDGVLKDEVYKRDDLP